MAGLGIVGVGNLLQAQNLPQTDLCGQLGSGITKVRLSIHRYDQELIAVSRVINAEFSTTIANEA